MPAETFSRVNSQMRRLQPISMALHLLQSATGFGAAGPDRKLNCVARDYPIKKKECLLSGLKTSKGRRHHRNMI